LQGFAYSGGPHLQGLLKPIRDGGRENQECGSFGTVDAFYFLSV
jgi:hypothetical protein